MILQILPRYILVKTAIKPLAQYTSRIKNLTTKKAKTAKMDGNLHTQDFQHTHDESGLLDWTRHCCFYRGRADGDVSFFPYHLLPSLLREFFPQTTALALQNQLLAPLMCSLLPFPCPRRLRCPCPFLLLLQLFLLLNQQ
jgi:hypothetical protein